MSQKYLIRIAELESQLRQKDQQLSLVEETEAFLRSALAPDGLCLFTKSLEEGQFIWPAVRDGKVSITRSQLAMLLDKLYWRQPKTFRLNSLTML